LRWVAGIGAVALLVGIGFWWASGKKFPPISSEESLHLMRALYTACSSQNDQRLAVVERKVVEAADAGQMSAEERAAFEEIVSYARADDWERAAGESYRFARDQVR
jgi:hypothetical protein